jgi:uncharacterized protein YPO0396
MRFKNGNDENEEEEDGEDTFHEEEKRSSSRSQKKRTRPTISDIETLHIAGFICQWLDVQSYLKQKERITDDDILGQVDTVTAQRTTTKGKKAEQTATTGISYEIEEAENLLDQVIGKKHQLEKHYHQACEDQEKLQKKKKRTQKDEKEISELNDKKLMYELEISRLEKIFPETY